MFQVKICGITRPDDARLAVEAGADAVGLNFYPSSPRCIDPETAEQIADSLPAGVARVGLFVNAAVDEIIALYKRLSLDWIQLHGDEPPEYLTELGQRPIMKAFRCGEAGLAPLGDYLDDCNNLGRMPDALLIDASHAGLYGGTGKTVDWSLLTHVRDVLGAIPLVLAGGLTPDNVAAAIRTVRPDAVDVSSGVESQPGVKDDRLVQTFVAAAREAFHSS